MDAPALESLAALRLIASELGGFTFPDLKRPRIRFGAPPTRELVDWGAQLYCFSWLSHVRCLLDGMIVLTEAGNTPAARMVARPLFELGAHAYYVTKHLKQHVEADAMLAAWDFLTPIATGSRYINAQFPEESELFPLPAHISKVINCFQEKIPEAAAEDYSYLSEFCHPNVLGFLQYYEYSNPETVRFVEPNTRQGFSGATVAAIIQGLLSLMELLELTREHHIRRSVVGLLLKLAQAKGQSATA